MMRTSGKENQGVAVAVGTPRAADGKVSHLILEYQKSVSALAIHRTIYRMGGRLMGMAS